MSTFAQLLVQYMDRVGISNSELARRVGFHRHTLIRWRRGEIVRPDCDKIRACIPHLQLSQEDANTLLMSAGCAYRRQEQVEAFNTEAFQDLEEMPEDILSPFVVGMPITEPRQFYGREAILQRITKLWRRFPLQNIAVIGDKRRGKSSLLHYLKQTVKETVSPLHETILVDFKEARMRQQSSLLNHLLDSLNMPRLTDCSLVTFEELISHQGLRNPTIILMDDIEYGLDSPDLDQAFWWGLRSIQHNYAHGKLGFLLTSRQSPAELADEKGKPSPFFNVFGYQVTLDKFSEADAVKLIQRSPIAFADADIQWIIEHSQREPALLQSLCEIRLQSLEDGANPHDFSWRNHLQGSSKP